MKKFDRIDKGMIHIPDADVSFVPRKYLDLAYAGLSPAQKLDIYLPETAEGPFPVLVNIHGGGFELGDKRDIHLLPFLKGIERGYAVVSLNYRLSGEACFPAGVQDVKAALRWLRANQQAYHLDGGRIAACGGSAGGHLAVMLGATGESADFDDPALGNIEQSSGVQAVVDWFGPIDFLAMDDQLAAAGLGPADHNQPDLPELRWMGAPIREIAVQVRRSSPLAYLHAGMPPVFIQHGGADNLVPTQQSVVLYEKLREILPEGKVWLEILPGCGHGDPRFESEENMEKVFAFLDKALTGSEHSSTSHSF